MEICGKIFFLVVMLVALDVLKVLVCVELRMIVEAEILVRKRVEKSVYICIYTSVYIVWWPV